MSNDNPSRAVPRTIALRQAVNQSLKYSGEVGNARLGRVVSAVLAAPDTFEVSLAFERNELEKPCASLTVRGEVELECQRCLQPVKVPLYSSAKLVFVAHDEEAKTVTGERDPWVVSGDQLDVDELLEDELLLALPGVALHKPNGGLSGIDKVADACVAMNLSFPGSGSHANAGDDSSVGHDGREQIAGSQQPSDNPFKVLAKLKQ